MYADSKCHGPYFHLLLPLSHATLPVGVKSHFQFNDGAIRFAINALQVEAKGCVRTGWIDAVCALSSSHDYFVLSSLGTPTIWGISQGTTISPLYFLTFKAADINELLEAAFNESDSIR